MSVRLILPSHCRSRIVVVGEQWLICTGQMATFAMTQQRTNSLEVECQELRDKLKAADEALYNSRITERTLREIVHSLDGQLERQKRETEWVGARNRNVKRR